MILSKLTRTMVIWATVWVFIAGRLVEGATPTIRGENANVVRDIRLTSNGCIAGVLVDAANRPMTHAKVTAWQQAKIVGSTETDTGGQFAIRVDHGGVYQIEAAGSIAVCRAWTEKAAPPSAAPAILVTAGQVVRAQNGLYTWISENPWKFYGLLATAIVVPAVLVASDDDSSS